MKTDKKIVKYSHLKKIKARARREGKNVILTTGCYDLLHLGHIIHFHFCKNQGDLLIVSVGNDATVRALKGPHRPINGEKFRARMIAALEVVDYVVISEEFGKMDHLELVEILRPDIYVVNATDSALEEKRKMINKIKGKLVACRRLPPGNKKGEHSTTKIEQKLHEELKD